MRAIGLGSILLAYSTFDAKRPSRRRQKEAAPQGERFCLLSERELSVHPEEVHFLGTVSKDPTHIRRLVA